MGSRIVDNIGEFHEDNIIFSECALALQMKLSNRIAGIVKIATKVINESQLVCIKELFIKYLTNKTFETAMYLCTTYL